MARQLDTTHDSAGLKIQPASGPGPITSLIGRDTESRDVTTALEYERLVILVGPGGAGKTRLAVAVAEAAAALFPDGIVFVSLAAIGEPDQVMPAIAKGVGAWQDPVSLPVDQAVAAIGDRRTLLVLDNFEHVVEAAPAIWHLIARCANLKILVTSRVPMRLSGELVNAVPPLSTPDQGREFDFERITSVDAVKLFVERAHHANPKFEMTSLNAGPVAEICNRLDGLPLAIELAAAWIRVLSPQALLTRLEQALPLLTGGSRDLPARQQTMREAIAWSYNLLSPELQAVFRRLAIFTGEFSLPDATFVVQLEGEPLPPDGPIALLRIFTDLVDQSLLITGEGPDGEPRFRLLATIREFGLEQLAANTDEERATRLRHAEWCLSIAREADPGWRGRVDAGWFDHMEQIYHDLRSALEWLFSHGHAALGAQLVAGSLRYWIVRGRANEGQYWIESALSFGADHPADISPSQRTDLLFAASWIAVWQRENDRAAALANEMMELGNAMNDREALSEGIRTQSILATYAGESDRALILAKSAATIGYFDNPGKRTGWTLNRLAVALGEKRDLDDAARMLELCLEQHQRTGDSQGAVYAMVDVGVVEHVRGNFRDAANRYLPAATLNQQLKDFWHTADLAGLVASLAAEAGDFANAATLLGASSAAYSISASVPLPYIVDIHEKAAGICRQALGDDSYPAAFEAGKRMTVDETRARTLATVTHLIDSDTLISPESPGQEPFGLTQRERSVLELIVQGKTDQQIADELFVSRRTVNTHVANLLGKLGVASRAEAAATAVRLGLDRPPSQHT